MNFAFVCSLNPESVSTWSGTPHFIIEGLRQLGHTVTIVCSPKSSWQLEARIKGRIYRHLFGRSYHAGRSPVVLRGRARSFNQQLENLSGIDYVLAIFPVDAAFLKSAKPIAIIHDATWHQLLDFYPGLERHGLANETIKDGYASDLRALRNCTKAVYFSSWARASAINDMGCEQGKVRAIAPGANLSVRPSESDVLQYVKARPRDRCQLLLIGQDWRRKGAAKAVAVAKCLNELGTPADLYIIGCRPPHGQVLPDFVHLLGFLKKSSDTDRKTIEGLLATSHFFILPTEADCTPIACCEAAAYGVPCLSHDVGGVASIIQNGKNGYTFSLLSKPQEWAQCLQTAFANAANYAQLATRTMQDSNTRLNWASFCKELVAFINA